jgi:AcrR family transcriptional regulator
VLDGALAAFLDFGIRRTSMNEIARRSGVSPASLYRWYGTKDELVTAVAIRETQRFLAEVEAQVDAEAPADAQLAEVSVLVAHRLRDQPLLRRLIETEPESVLPRLTVDAGPIIEAGAAYLTGHIERLMDEGRIERFDPRPLAELLARATHSMLLTPPTGPPPDDDQLRTAARESMRWLFHLAPRSPT